MIQYFETFVMISVLMYILDRKCRAVNASGCNFRRGCGATPAGVFGGNQIFKSFVSNNYINAILHFLKHISITNSCHIPGYIMRGYYHYTKLATVIIVSWKDAALDCLLSQGTWTLLSMLCSRIPPSTPRTRTTRCVFTACPWQWCSDCHLLSSTHSFSQRFH